MLRAGSAYTRARAKSDTDTAYTHLTAHASRVSLGCVWRVCVPTSHMTIDDIPHFTARQTDLSI